MSNGRTAGIIASSHNGVTSKEISPQFLKFTIVRITSEIQIRSQLVTCMALSCSEWIYDGAEGYKANKTGNVGITGRRVRVTIVAEKQ